MEFSRDWLHRYLTHRLAAPVEIMDIVRFPRGSSRETWFITYRNGPTSAPVSIVFRMDQPAGSTDPSPLRQEYFMYERLGHTAVPVAKTLWWEEDPAWLGTTGQAFYARAHVDGDWDIPHLKNPDPQYDELRIEISKEHLNKLALIHTLDWKALGFDQILPAPARVEDCAHHFIDVSLANLERYAHEAIPLVLEACEWLHDHAPTAPRISLCKGTNGFGEEVFRDRKIVAMSDWEEATIGDPAADFAFLQDLIPEIEHDGRVVWGLEMALDYYRSVSGITVTADSVRYYRLLRALRTVAFSNHAGLAVSRRGGAHIRQAWTATEVVHVGKNMLSSAIGLTPPLPLSRFQELLETV